MEEGRLERDGVGLSYLEWAPDGEAVEPALLLVHGLSSNALVWKRLAPLLPGRRVVAVDQRGHGRSDAPASGYGNQLLAGDLEFLIAELGLGRPVVAGHSWGASIALELAGGRPGLTSGLAIVDGPVAPMSLLGSWDDVAARMQPPLPLHASLDDAAAEVRRYLGAAWGDDLLDFVERGMVHEPAGWRSTLTAPVRLEILRAMYGAHPELLLPRVEGPILIAAAGDFRDWRERQVAMAAEIRPDAVVRWYDSAHDVPLIRPRELAADLERLAQRAAWQSLAAELADVEGDWSRPAQGDAEGWTAKDLLAHLSSTWTAMPRVVESALAPAAAGGERPVFDANRWNASQVGRRREQPPEALKAEAETAAAALDPVLAGADLEAEASAGPYAGLPLREVLAEMIAHQRNHLAELRRALRG